MKKILLSILLLANSLAHAADMPKQINVYSSTAAGLKGNVCRALFDEYAKQYNTTINYIIKPGAEGLIATKEMMEDPSLSLLCAGSSEKVFNTYAYPGNELLHEKLKTLVLIAKGPVTFSTRPENTSKNLVEFLKTKNDVNVGFNSQGVKFLVSEELKNVKINWIPFKTSGEAVSSILDGSLDFYAAAGSLETFTKSGKLKSLGYVNGTPITVGEDLTSKFPTIASLPIAFSIGISPNVNIETAKELNRRLIPIINNTESLNSIYAANQQTPFTTSYLEANTIIDSFRKKVKESYIKK